MTHPAAICADQNILTSIPYEWWEVGLAFSRQVTPQESAAIFQAYSQNRPYYVYLDPDNYHCVSGELFSAPAYTVIARSANLWLLRHD
jgi:hypothetical protein